MHFKASGDVCSEKSFLKTKSLNAPLLEAYSKDTMKVTKSCLAPLSVLPDLSSITSFKVSELMHKNRKCLQLLHLLW